MTKRLIKELESIKERLTNLQPEGEGSSDEIRADFFTLIKTTDCFGEYLTRINSTRFTPQDTLYNQGNHLNQDAFNKARENLVNIANQILREIKFGALKSKLLPPPETISISWILKNCSISFFISSVFILGLVFVAGAVVEQKYGSVKIISEYILHPAEKLESALKPPESNQGKAVKEDARNK